jgi:hypothetical protein
MAKQSAAPRGPNAAAERPVKKVLSDAPTTAALTTQMAKITSRRSRSRIFT